MILFQENYQTKWILGNKKTLKEKHCFKMGQYEIILANLKTIIEKQDKIFILMSKIVKFLEHFKPLIDWVRLFFINLFFGNSLGILWGILWEFFGEFFGIVWEFFGSSLGIQDFGFCQNFV